MRALAGDVVVATAVLAVADDGWQRPPARRSSRCRQPSINARTTSAAAITTSCPAPWPSTARPRRQALRRPRRLRGAPPHGGRRRRASQTSSSCATTAALRARV